METCKLTRHGCKYAHFNPDTDECHSCAEREEIYSTILPKELLDTRAIKPEKYAELREQDFDTWLDTILHEIIEQVNFDASEVDALGGAVWNGECPDGTPYPRQCAREDAYIQCIRQSNQLDCLKRTVSDLESQISSLQLQFDELKKFIGYTLADPAVSIHTGSNFCGNCKHHQHPPAPTMLNTCALSGCAVNPDDASCAMFESNQLDSKLFDKPDREECKHCPKEMCDNCMNYPF